MATQVPVMVQPSFLMWTHLLEVFLTGVGLFVGPLMILMALAGALTLLDRLFHFVREQQHSH